MTTLKPTVGKVFISQPKVEEKSAGGILLPPIQQKPSNQGIVVAAGSAFRLSDGTFSPSELKPGDKVIFNRQVAGMLKIDGEDLLIVKIDDVQAVIEEVPAESV